jgi:hypothetical protein
MNFRNGEPMGQIVITPKAQALGIDMAPLLRRYLTYDWGDMPDEDVDHNNESVRCNGGVMGAYKVDGNVIWIITDNGHEVTTILTPDEY